MKNFALGMAAALTLIASPVRAAPDGEANQLTWAKSDQAALEACFAQARAYHARLLILWGTSNGEYIRDRKGQNPEMNREWIEMFCGVPQR